VNKITPYESLIAQKAEQVPLPQLADSIWATIEQQLDAGTADGGDNSPSGNPPGKGLPGAGKLLYVLVPAAVIIATAWYYWNNKKTPADNIQQTTPVIPADTSTVQQDSSGQLVTPNEKSKIPLTLFPDTVSTVTNTVDSPGRFIDSTSLNTIQIPPADTTNIQTSITPTINPDTANKAPQTRKPKGVKGINAGDYKIVSDTTKRKN
jgi:hypothetical protein